MTDSQPLGNAQSDDPKSANSTAGNAEPLRSVHTSNLPAILKQLGISLWVSTYQAGKLVVLRAEGDVLNTHFRMFDKPMGLAIEPTRNVPTRLAMGTAMQVWEFHNVPAACTRLDSARDATDELPARLASPHPHDACFLPRVAHWTGDIDVHEMAWVNAPPSPSPEDENSDLIFINTRFSCLSRRSAMHSFEPVWRPAFIKSYLPGDCCHLNGMAVADGQVRYVTALGETEQPGGWRNNKVDGGLLIDVASGEVVSRGLSMPHSPRIYNGKLYVLHSGTGGFGTIDPATGKYESIIELPGFTRGLSFAGPLAFIGLSQVRESAVFGGVPIAEANLDERVCGVWVVNLETGQTVAFVKFEDAVQEIFSVEVMHGSTYPELVNEDRELLAGTYELSDAALADVPPELRHR